VETNFSFGNTFPLHHFPPTTASPPSTAARHPSSHHNRPTANTLRSSAAQADREQRQFPRLDFDVAIVRSCFLKHSLSSVFGFQPLQMSGGSEWNEYWGWGPPQDFSLHRPPPPADPCPWDTWSVHGAWPEFPSTTATSWGWSVWDNPLAIPPSTWRWGNFVNNLELVAVDDVSSKFSIYTEAPDLDENDFCIDQEDIFTLTIDEASTNVHVKLSLADAVVILSNARPDKIPDSECVFNELCTACGFSQQHDQPRPNMHFFSVEDVILLLRHQV
jgi:hypothetical protein